MQPDRPESKLPVFTADRRQAPASSLALLLLFGLLCGSELPAPTGPHAVGTEIAYLTDPARNDLPGAPRARELLVQLWYPAEAAPERERAPYLIELELIEALQHERYLDLEPDVLGAWADLETHSRKGAPLLAAPGKLPLLLFSPGFGMARASYTTLAEELASHGFVVAGIDHPHVGLMVSSDERVLTNGQDPRGEEAVAERVGEMARDARFVLDALLDPGEPLAHFAARLDGERVGVLGHSLGGAMALEAGRVDARFKACVDLDGAPFGAVETEGVGCPALVVLNQPERSKRPPPAMGKERHETWVRILAKHPTPAYIATIENTNHFSFSDLPFLVPPERMARTGATLAPRRNLELLARLLRAFFDGSFAREGGEAPAVVAREYPEITFESL